MPPYLQTRLAPAASGTSRTAHEPGYRGEGIYYEEVVTTAGFGRAYSICYHLRPPTRVRKVEPAGDVDARDASSSRCCGTITCKTGSMPAGRRPDHRAACRC